MFGRLTWTLRRQLRSFRHGRGARSLLLLTALLTVTGGAVKAQSAVHVFDPVERLIYEHAPLLFLHPEERWFPDSVETFLRGAHVRDDQGDILPINNSQLPAGGRSLDFHLVTRLPRGLGTDYVQQPAALRGTSPLTGSVPVYVSLTRCTPLETNNVPAGDEPNNELNFHVTYWLFFPFNEGKRVFGKLFGNHVGDWEHVSIRFQNGVAASVYISAHEFGAYYVRYPDTGTFIFEESNNRGGVEMDPKYPPQLEMFGTHPVLYVAKGSHGMWPTSAVHVYSDWPHLEDVTGRGTPWQTWNSLVMLHRARPQWMEYMGRWGNPGSTGFLCRLLSLPCSITAGPTGIPLKPKNFRCRRTEPAASRQLNTSWWPFGRRRR